MPKNHLHTESPMPMIKLYVDLTDCWKNAYKPALEIGQLPHIYQLPSCCVRFEKAISLIYCCPNHLSMILYQDWVTPWLSLPQVSWACNFAWAQLTPGNLSPSEIYRNRRLSLPGVSWASPLLGQSVHFLSYFFNVINVHWPTHRHFSTSNCIVTVLIFLFAMNVMKKSQFVVVSKPVKNGKVFNPYCFCDKRACNGVKKAQTGKITFSIT